jgi:AraC-like DNA-binding protein
MNKIFFSGLFNKESENYIINEGALNIFGICFKTSGFYPFINSNLYEFKNHFWNLNETKLKFSSNFYNKLIETTTNEEIIEIVEKELYNNLLTDNQQFNKFKEIFHYYENSKYSRDISEFCLKQKINIRKFERDFNKYIGISAKSYTSINRFQNSINQLLNKDFDKLSDIAYENGYYDQTHYINEFKKFTGNNPKKFDQQKNSLLNIGKLKEK